jgi:predicted HicB family RNase H-like nuclease
MKKKKNKDLEYYMSLNYPFTVELYKENGELRFGLQVPELQGVWADGKTVEEAYADLIETKRLWFETCLEKGVDIPEPVLEKDFSGKFILRLDPRLHRTLSERAQKSRISLNQYIRLLLEKQISNSDLIAEITQLRQFIAKQSETIEKLRKELATLEHRIGSLEEAFSSTGSGWGGIIFATTEEYFKGATAWSWDKEAVGEGTVSLIEAK